MTFVMACEEMLPWFGLTAKCTLWEGTPDNPTNIIRTTEPWGVKFEWTTTGPLNHLIAGNWKLECYLEMMGPGEAPAIGAVSVPVVSAPNAYSRVVNGPTPMNEGVYKLATTIKIIGPAPFNRPGPIACMGEGPMIQFYVAAFP